MLSVTLCVAISTLFVGFVTTERRGLIVTAPRIFLAGSTERVCVQFHHIDFDVHMGFKLSQVNKKEILHEVTANFQNGEGRCVDFPVPQDIEGSQLDFTVAASSTSPSVDYRFMDSQTIELKHKSLLSFIQTDKPQYKPGQTVKFRLLSVDAELKPRLDPIPQVWIQDPSGTRMMQWTDVQTESGLASLEMKLAEEPTQGTWKISADMAGVTESQDFKVEEYVLPKYEIVINPPPFILIDSPTIKGEVCAKYTYGEPVKGKLKLHICLIGSYSYSRHGKRPCKDIETEIKGCAPFEFAADEVMLNSRQFSVWGIQLQVNASVEEEATGVVLNASKTGPNVDQTPLKIDITKSPDYFKPGLTYYGKGQVSHPDGSPAVGKIITVNVDNWREQFNFERNYTTDTRGQFKLQLPLEEMDDQNVKSIAIQAFAPNYQRSRDSSIHVPQEPRTYYTVKRWFSPSGTFVQIDPIEGTVPCSGNLRVRITYTAHDQSAIKLFYQVMARGNIVTEGHKSHNLGHHGNSTNTGTDRSAQPGKNENDQTATGGQGRNERECSGGRQWKTCGTHCPPTCEDPMPPCIKLCARGCHCPMDRPLWHNEQCITQSQCPGERQKRRSPLIERRKKRRNCPSGQKWMECGSPCKPTCENPNPMCAAMCVEGCSCPRSRPIMHEGGCIARSQCGRAPTTPKPLVAPLVGHFHLDIPVDTAMSGDARVLVYYILEDGETVADSTGFTVAQCLENNVSIAFAHAERLPGERTQLLIKADPKSLCAVGVVDKSVHILGGSNQLSIAKVFRLLGEYDIEETNTYGRDEYCEKQLGNGNSRPPFPGMMRNKRSAEGEAEVQEINKRAKRSSFYPGRFYSSYYDSSKAFKRLGSVVVSDLIIDTRPCNHDQRVYMRKSSRGGVQFSPSANFDEMASEFVALRSGCGLD